MEPYETHLDFLHPASADSRWHTHIPARQRPNRDAGPLPAARHPEQCDTVRGALLQVRAPRHGLAVGVRVCVYANENQQRQGEGSRDAFHKVPSELRAQVDAPPVRLSMGKVLLVGEVPHALWWRFSSGSESGTESFFWWKIFAA